jgi:hypothetical protein
MTRFEQRVEIVHLPPAMGSSCVCCGGDTQGRTQPYFIDTTTLEVPVCRACKDHAHEPSHRAARETVPLVISIVAGLMAVVGALPSIPGIGIAIVFATLWAALLARGRLRRARALLIDGHHPWLEMTEVTGKLWIDTTNGELVEELLACNESARRTTTPQLPSARVFERDKS